MDADVGEAAAVDQGAQAGQAVDEGLAADQPDLAVRLRLGGEMFAAAETNFEPYRVGLVIEQGRRIESRLGGDQQSRQQRIDQRLAAPAQPLAVTPPVELPVPYQQSAAFRSSTRSRRSQEKPPSASGARPKWP